MAVPATVDEYLASLSDDERAALESTRATVNAAAPDADESIAYGMPALRSHGGRFLVSYAAFKHHYSLFPASGAVVEACGDELTPYLSGKGTIQFPLDAPLPAALVKRLVKARAAKLLGISRPTLDKKIADLGVDLWRQGS